MGYIFENLYIENFKGFKKSTSIKITDLNILTGKNNAGKSSLIELINVLYLSLSSDGLNTLKFSELENFFSFDNAINYDTDSDEIILNFPYNLKYFGPKKLFHVKFIFVKSINKPLDGFLKSIEYYFIKSNGTPKELLFSLNHEESIRVYPSSKKKLRFEPLDSNYYCNIPLIMNLVDNMIENTKKLNSEEDKVQDANYKSFWEIMMQSVPTIKEFTTPIYSNDYNKIEFKKSTPPYIEYYDYAVLLKDIDPSSNGTIYNYNHLDDQNISKNIHYERSIELQFRLPSNLETDTKIAKIKEDFKQSLTIFHEKKVDGINVDTLKVTPFGELIFDSIIKEFLTPINRDSIKYEKPTIVDVGTNPKLNNLLKTLYNNNISIDSIEHNFLKFWLNEFGYGKEYRLIQNNHNIEITFNKNKKIESFGRGLQSLIKILITITCNAHTNYVGPNIGYSSSLMILIEPESNLHPDLQSKLADLLVDSNNKFKTQFIVETHSEYLIRKLQYWTSMGTITPNATILNYFEKDNKEKTIIINQITIDEDGNLSDNFGEGFIDHAPKLMLDLLNLKKKNNLN